MENILKRCLTCLNENNLSSINEIKDGISYYKKIKICIPQLESNEYDIQQGYLCAGCKSFVYNFYEFFDSCMKSKSVIENMVYDLKKKDNAFPEDSPVNINKPDVNDMYINENEIDIHEEDIDNKNDPELCLIKEAFKVGDDPRETVPPEKRDDNKIIIEFVDVGSSNPENNDKTNLLTTESIKNEPKDMLNPGNVNQSKHTCDICGKVFSQVWNLKSHIKYGHNDNNPQFVKIAPKDILLNNTSPERKKHSCNKCGKSFPKVKNLKAHTIYQHNTQPDHKCSICNKYFTEVGSLRKHFNVHKDTYKYQCEKCSFRFLTKEELTTHKNQLRCYLKEKIKCNYCNSYFHREAALTRHMNDRHIKEKHFTCELCDKKFLRNYSLLLHKKNMHGGKEIACEICNKKFATNGILKNHIKTHFTEGKKNTTDTTEEIKSKNEETENKTKDNSRRFQCDLCGKLYSGNIDKHLRTHNNERSYQCTFCPNKFTDNLSRSEHIHQMHLNEKNQICHICGKTFFYKSSLDKHIKLHNSPEKYTCHICEKSFKEENTLKKHRLLHMGDIAKKFECNVCGKKVWSNTDLIRHIRTHTGEKPYVCEICGKSFAIKRQVTVHHNFIHVTVRPYLCTICNKRFATQNCLNQHVKLHSQNRPYKCEFCPKAFKYKYHIQRHLNQGACKNYTSAIVTDGISEIINKTK